MVRKDIVKQKSLMAFQHYDDVIFEQSRRSTWSRGMIPASGAGGRGFDSRSGPTFAPLVRICTLVFFNIQFHQLQEMSTFAFTCAWSFCQLKGTVSFHIQGVSSELLAKL